MEDLRHILALSRRTRMLSAAEEVRLVGLAQQGSRRSAETLVLAHLRLVIAIARKFRGYGQPTEDLVSEGCLGLLRAVPRFDLTREVRFATFASWWVHAAISEHVMHSHSLLKIGTTAQSKRLFFRLRSMKARLGILSDHLTADQIRQIADGLGVLEDDVVQMNVRLTAEQSLDAPAGVDAAGDSRPAWIIQLRDGAPDPETLLGEQQELGQRRVFLAAALDQLDTRSRAIFVARRLDDPSPSLAELAVHFGVSRERIRQIEVAAFQKVQAVMTRGGVEAAA
jgi:RNA polymerase sigma-32 factor